jgi:predicted dehydrogenase
MMRLGMIGSGAIAGGHLRASLAIPDRVKFVALASRPSPSRVRRSQQYALTRLYDTAGAMLAETDIDGVVICTPNDTHLPLTLEALAAGKHVLVEKPMACTVVDGQRMVDQAERAGRTLMVAQCQRYEPAYQAVKRAIDSGELGHIRLARVEAMQSAAVFNAPGHWMLDGQRAGGGIVINVAVHKLDLLRWYLGEPAWVRATCRPAPAPFINGAEDLALAMIGFTNGAIADLFATWSAFRLRYSENLQLFGTRGAVHGIPPVEAQIGAPLIASAERCAGGPTTGFASMFGGFTPADPAAPNPPSDLSFTHQLAHFASACETGTAPLTSGRDNLGTLRLVEAIYTSGRADGERIALG